ncbi:hypothetical protein BpHYR1_019189, partial [Brachionus plicatilis]
ISTDFELSIINAVDEVFSDTETCGCFFHIKKSIWRHVQEYGLATAYKDIKEDNQTKLYTKMLACLAFVPVEEVVSAFETLKKASPSNLGKLYKYFEQYYIGPLTRGRSPKR